MLNFIDKILKNLSKIIGYILIINGIGVAFIAFIFLFLLLLASNHSQVFELSVQLGDSTINYITVVVTSLCSWFLVFLGRKIKNK